MNFEQARSNMITQQIKPWNVSNQTILDLFADIPREDFMPIEYQRLALSETQIPLSHGQFSMLPKVEARLLQALKIKPSDEILEVGTGSGYLTALLCRLGQHVYSVDIYDEFIEQAQMKLYRHNIKNITLKCRDAVRGWRQYAPYDVIVVTASVPELESHFQEQLSINGHLFIIVGEKPVMQAMLIKRTANKRWKEKILFETDIDALVGTIPNTAKFSF